jgi:hypothetical protein
MAALVASVILLYLLFCVLTALVILLYRQFGLVFLGSRRSYELPGPAVGELAPAGLQVASPGNPALTLALDWRDVPPGGATLLLLGGEVCPVCAHLLRHLNEGPPLAPEPAKVRVLFVDKESRGMPTVELPVPVNERWQHWRSTDGSVHRAFDVEVSPFGIVIDGEGRIRSKGIVSSRPEISDLLARAGLEAEISETAIMLSDGSATPH